jgi:hypothetical protein
MIIYDIHLIVDDSVEFDLMTENLQQQLTALKSEWPSFPALSTKSFQSRKVIHARVQHPDLTELLLTGLFAAFGLNWVVLGIRQSVKTPATYDIDGIELTPAFYKVIKSIEKAAILPFLADITDGMDANGNPVYRPVLLSDTIYLPMYIGTEPLVV